LRVPTLGSFRCAFTEALRRVLDSNRGVILSGSAGDEDQGARSVLSRCALLRRVLLATGALSLGGVNEAFRPPVAAALPGGEARILNFLLQLEYIQEAFYAKAASKKHVSGELLRFAQVAVAQEREHVHALEQLLAGAARGRPQFKFGRVPADPARFGPAALELEETTAAAYIGQSANLSASAIGTIASIVSVDARHAAWVRDILRRLPAPRAADREASAREVERTIRSTGFVS
jgi:hypothetical protein